MENDPRLGGEPTRTIYLAEVILEAFKLVFGAAAIVVTVMGIAIILGVR